MNPKIAASHLQLVHFIIYSSGPLSHLFCLAILIFLIFGSLSYIDHIFLLPKLLQFYSLVKVQPFLYSPLIKNSHNLFFSTPKL